METALFGVFDFVARNKWLQYILIALAVIATLGLYLAMRDEGVKRRERERWLRKQAEERERMVERTHEIITEERQNADEALQARDSGERYPDYDSLPDSHKAIAEGRAGPRLQGGS